LVLYRFSTSPQNAPTLQGLFTVYSCHLATRFDDDDDDDDTGFRSGYREEQK